MTVGMYGLVGLLVFSRLFVMRTIASVPDMEPYYIQNAQQLFESQNKFEMYLAPGYSALLYGVNLIFRNWEFSSQAIYVVFSILGVLVWYAMARALFDVETARYAMLIMIFLPNLTSAVAGYSHAIVPAMFFLYLAAYVYWFLWTEPTIPRAAGFAIFILLATSIRPDNALYFLLFVSIFIGTVLYRGKRWPSPRGVMALCIILAIFGGGLYVHYRMTQARSSSPYGTVLGNARYSYITYTHTLSLRAVGFIDERVAERLGAVAFGPAEENRFSIVRAVAKNPREALKNIAYNARTLLKEAGSPLFIPIFLYPFLGVGLFSVPWRERWRQYFFLGSLLLPCLAMLILFHVEIRYMSPLVPPLVMVMASGIRHLSLDIRRYVVISLIVILAGVFTASAFHLRSAKDQAYPKPGSDSLIPTR